MSKNPNSANETGALSRRDLLGWTGRIGGAAAVAATMPKMSEFILGSTPAHAADKPLNIAVIGQQMSAQSDQRSWDGMQSWMKGVGVDKKWKVNLTDAKGDPGKLVSQIQDAVTAKVDAIIVLFGTLTAAHAALEFGEELEHSVLQHRLRLAGAGDRRPDQQQLQHRWFGIAVHGRPPAGERQGQGEDRRHHRQLPPWYTQARQGARDAAHGEQLDRASRTPASSSMRASTRRRRTS